MMQLVNRDFRGKLSITENLNTSEFYRRLCQVQIPTWNSWIAFCRNLKHILNLIFNGLKYSLEIMKAFHDISRAFSLVSQVQCHDTSIHSLDTRGNLRILGQTSGIVGFAFQNKRSPFIHCLATLVWSYLLLDQTRYWEGTIFLHFPTSMGPLKPKVLIVSWQVNITHCSVTQSSWG